MNTINKIILTLTLAHCCQQNIIADIKPIPYPLSPEKRAELIQEKKRQLEFLEKEIKYYGSEGPFITNVHIGFVAAAIGAIICLTSDESGNKIIGAAIGVGGLGISAISGASSDDTHKVLISSHGQIRKELDTIIIHDSNNQ